MEFGLKLLRFLYFEVSLHTNPAQRETYVYTERSAKCVYEIQMELITCCAHEYEANLSRGWRLIIINSLRKLEHFQFFAVATFLLLILYLIIWSRFSSLPTHSIMPRLLKQLNHKLELTDLIKLSGKCYCCCCFFVHHSKCVTKKPQAIKQCFRVLYRLAMIVGVIQWNRFAIKPILASPLTACDVNILEAENRITYWITHVRQLINLIGLIYINIWESELFFIRIYIWQKSNWELILFFVQFCSYTLTLCCYLRRMKKNKSNLSTPRNLNRY